LIFRAIRSTASSQLMSTHRSLPAARSALDRIRRVANATLTGCGVHGVDHAISENATTCRGGGAPLQARLGGAFQQN
jgi:hypothetical protein